MHTTRLVPGATVLLTALALVVPAKALVIIPTFDSSITGDANSATIQATINSAIATYTSRFSDPITVRITFQTMGSGLGQSSTFFFSAVNYTDVRSALISDATTANDAIALAHLAGTSVSARSGGSTMAISTAAAKAMGLVADSYYTGTDSTISLNTSLMNLTRTSINPALYDLQAVVQHEIDEALGLGSGIGGEARLEDLFRYTGAGVPTFTATGDDAYFSIDGTTLLARFNQNAGGDYGDWWSFGGGQTPQVQDAFGTPGATPNLGVELTALDVIGYNLVAIPEPAAAPLAFGAITAFWVLRRRAGRTPEAPARRTTAVGN